MLAKLYMEYIYQIEGEKILKNPISIFDNSGVYLLIDKDLKQIWIWAGSRSKLFHRYIYPLEYLNDPTPNIAFF